jgi:hypothetical protein
MSVETDTQERRFSMEELIKALDEHIREIVRDEISKQNNSININYTLKKASEQAMQEIKEQMTKCGR